MDLTHEKKPVCARTLTRTYKHTKRKKTLTHENTYARTKKKTKLEQPGGNSLAFGQTNAYWYNTMNRSRCLPAQNTCNNTMHK